MSVRRKRVAPAGGGSHVGGKGASAGRDRSFSGRRGRWRSVGVRRPIDDGASRRELRKTARKVGSRTAPAFASSGGAVCARSGSPALGAVPGPVVGGNVAAMWPVPRLFVIFVWPWRVSGDAGTVDFLSDCGGKGCLPAGGRPRCGGGAGRLGAGVGSCSGRHVFCKVPNGVLPSGAVSEEMPAKSGASR